MERKEIKKGRQGRMGFKTKLIIAMLLTALFTQTSSAFGWGKIITLMVGGLQGLVWMVIAMLLLLFVELANAVLIKLLWCTLAMNPTVYGSGFTSQYACVTFGATVPQGVTSMIALFMKILYPMFVVAFVVLATYFIFMAPSPPHRARAKQMLTKIITAMVLTALAPLIYQILIMVAGAMTDGVLEVIDTQILPQNNDGLFKRLLTATMSANPIHFEGSISSQVIEAITSPVKVFAALIALTLMLVFWSIAIMVSLFRYIAVLFLGIIFPLTIAMYMFEFTRNPGRKLLKATIVFIFTPFIMSIWLAVGLSLLKGMTPDTGYFTGLFLMLAMSVLISWSPLQLSGVLNVIGAIVTSIGQFIPHWIGTVLVALGGIMQGKGASAISGAALKFAGGKLTSKLKGGLTKGFAAFRKGGFKELGAAAMGGMRGMGSSMRNLPGMARGALGNIGGSIGRSLSNAATKITAKGALKFGARVVAGKLIEKATFGMASLRGTGSSSSGSGGAGGGKGFEAGKTLKNIQEGLSALRKMGLKGVGKAACVGAGLSLAGVAAGLAFGSVAFGVGVGVAGLGLAFGTKTGRRMVGRAIKSSWREGARATWGKLGETALAGASIAGVAGASLGVAAAAVALGPVLAAGVVGVAGLGLAFGTKTGRKGLGVALGAVAKAASGLAASVRTGVQGIGQSLRKGGALKAAGVGASIAGAIGLAAAAPMIALGAGAVGLGAAALSKPGRNLISGMARGAGRSLSRITPKAWKGIMDKAKEHGVGRLTGLGMRAVLGEYNFGRYLKKAAELRGKKAWSGRTRATVGALAGRGIQKALGVTDKQMEALDRRAEGAMKLRNLEAVRNDVLDVMDGKKQVGDLTAEGKNALKEISGLGSGAIDNDLQTWVNSNKAAGTKATNEHFNKEADEIKKNYGTDEQISDQKNANRSLIEDAKTEQQQIEDARKEALNYTGKERIAGVKKAEELEAKNPSGIDESKAKTLAEYGIHTRGQLANINSEGMKDVKNAIIKAGISENDLDKLQKGAEKGCHRKTTKREQAMRDSGITEEDQMKDKRERDHRLRDELTRGGKKPEEKEDFLTAIEEERQQ